MEKLQSSSKKTKTGASQSITLNPSGKSFNTLEHISGISTENKVTGNNEHGFTISFQTKPIVFYGKIIGPWMKEEK